MALQFIFGNSGSGKSHYLYQKVIEDSMNHPDLNYLVLVPEQFTMQTQKDLCTLHPRHGIMNIDVLSFGRLAHRIFEETGQDTKRVLDDEGKNLILRKKMCIRDRYSSMFFSNWILLKSSFRRSVLNRVSSRFHCAAKSVRLPFSQEVS